MTKENIEKIELAIKKLEELKESTLTCMQFERVFDDKLKEITKLAHHFCQDEGLRAVSLKRLWNIQGTAPRLKAFAQYLHSDIKCLFINEFKYNMDEVDIYKYFLRKGSCFVTMDAQYLIKQCSNGRVISAVSSLGKMWLIIIIDENLKG